MLSLLRFVRGYIEFEVSGGYPERFITACGRAGLPLYRLRRGEHGLRAATALRNKKLLRNTASGAGVTLKLLGEHGVPTLISRYRRRAVVFAGMAALLLVPVLLSMFIWQIEIVGNETVPTGQLRATLSELGVHRGAFRHSLNARAIERDMLIRNEAIRWVGVNLHGSRAVVEVREREDVPKPLDILKPTNVVASKGGFITRMDVYEGYPTVKSGDSVLPGDILVSGIMENGKQQSRTVHARAQVLAQVEESLAVTVPYSRTVYGYRGYLSQRTLCLPWASLPLDIAGDPEQPYKLESASEPLTLFGLALPVQIVRQNYILLEQAQEEVTPQEARLEAEQQLELLEKQKFPEGSIISRELTGQEFDDKFILFADYLRVCDIAEEREILTE